MCILLLQTFPSTFCILHLRSLHWALALGGFVLHLVVSNLIQSIIRHSLRSPRIPIQIPDIPIPA